MHTSKSDITSGSKRCCNRTTCPFYMCSRQNSGTVFESAQDETSTQFLYFGQNFGGNPSGELQEFKDCRSDSDSPMDTAGNGQKSYPNASLSGIEPSNYRLILKQIICMSQKLLAQLERREEGNSIDAPPIAGSGFGGNYMPGSQPQNMQQMAGPTPNFGSAPIYSPSNAVAPAPTPNFGSAPRYSPSNAVAPAPTPNFGNAPRYSPSNAVAPAPTPNFGNGSRYSTNNAFPPPSAGAGNIPLGLRMLQIEPVHLTIPFTLHFQGVPATGGMPVSSSATSGIIGPVRVSSITSPSVHQKNVPGTSTTGFEYFPPTLATQTDKYVSQGKFPPIKLQKQSIDEGVRNVVRDEPRFSVPPPHLSSIVDEVCDLPIDKQLEQSFQPGTKIDKGMQTEKRRSKKDFDLQSTGEVGEERPDRRPSRDGQDERDRENTEDGQYPQETTGISENCTETDSHRNNSYLDPVTLDAAVQTESRRSSEQQPLYDRNSSVGNLQHVSFSGRGEEEPTIKTEQLLYVEIEQQRQSELQVKQLQQLLQEHELYEKPPPPLDISENRSISSKLPHNMSYPSQYGRNDQYPSCMSLKKQQQSDTDVSPNEIPVCCRCMCSKKRMSRSKPCKSGMGAAQKSRSNFSCRSLVKKKSSTRIGDDDYYSPLSDSEVEKRPCPVKKICPKQRVSKPCADRRPQDVAMLEVLERMVKVLDCMHAVNRQNLRPTRSSSIRPSSQLGDDEHDLRFSESVDMERNMERRFFTCLEKSGCSEESLNDENCNDNEVPEDTVPDKTTTDNMPCCVPYMMITFDPETGLPCCCLHSGALNSPCQEVPVLNASNAVPCKTAAKCMKIPNNRSICQSDDYDDEDDDMCGDMLMQDEMQIINETQIRVVTTEECNICEEDYEPPIKECITVEPRLSSRNILITLCAETQTEECLGPFPASVGATSIDLLDELRAFRDELCESESGRNTEDKMKSSSKSRSGGDIRSECDCCHCRSQRESPQQVCNTVDNCKKELKALVDSVIMDLESMEMVRRQNMYKLKYNDESSKQPKCAVKSFPVTITEVTELGRSSLYVKWAIHDCFGIGGYEIYVDGYLTNRYFNPRHEAAVVCEIDVRQPHKIALMAKPKKSNEKSIMGAGDVYAEDDPTPTPKYWTPSTYLYEPNSSMDYCKMY